MFQILGAGFDYSYLPAAHTRGGILVVWRTAVWSVASASAGHFSVSIRIQQVPGGEDWWLTSVCGPSTDTEKPEFLAELHNLQQVRTGPWLTCGDFNMIYRAEDKSNGHLNRRLMR
jgi:hypothetical protein